MLDPFSFLCRAVDGEMGEEFPRQVDVADFIGGVDVVDLTDFTLVEDRVEGIRCVRGEEVAAGVEA